MKHIRIMCLIAMYTLLGISYLFPTNNPESIVYLQERTKQKSFLSVENNQVKHTINADKATHFTLENITEVMMQKYGLGNSHYLIRYNNFFLNVNPQKELYLGEYDEKESHWSSVIHYQYWHILKNNGYELEQIEPK